MRVEGRFEVFQESEMPEDDPVGPALVEGDLRGPSMGQAIDRHLQVDLREDCREPSPEPTDLDPILFPEVNTQEAGEDVGDHRVVRARVQEGEFLAAIPGRDGAEQADADHGPITTAVVPGLRPGTGYLS